MSGEFVTRSNSACSECGGGTCSINNWNAVKRYWSGGATVDAKCTVCGAPVRATG